jgi:hypothetical protein
MARKKSRNILDKNGNDIKVVINGDKLKGTILSRNGTYLFKAMQGRVFTLAKVGNFYLPFYISSAGTSGKIQGQWYPFFGYNNWLVKGHVGKSGEMEYSKNITEVQNLLNENFIIPAQYLQADNVVAVGEQFVPERDANGKIIREGKYNFEKMIPNKDRKVLYDLTKDIDIITHHHQEQKGETKLNEHDWVAEKTGLNPKKVINDGKGSADNWIKKLVELTETKSKATTQYTEAAGGSALKDIKAKKADIEKRNTFTRKTQMRILPKGTPVFGGKVADGKTEFLNTDLGLEVGDEVTFYAERERKGVWDGKYIREVGTNNPWGLFGILVDTTAWLRNDTKINAELKAVEESNSASTVKPTLPTRSVNKNDVSNKRNRRNFDFSDVSDQLENNKAIPVSDLTFLDDLQSNIMGEIAERLLTATLGDQSLGTETKILDDLSNSCIDNLDEV